ncbi:terminase small subunit [Rahnella sp. PCH160]|uniref:terminase small subunit n=1 Tax=Rahnella sp. PCH160 TaxID=3447928 RepID=UPI0039FCD70D
MAEKGKLNAQMELFCQEMLRDPRNQRQAAINAGYSVKTATQKAAGLMNLPKVIARIEALMEARNKRLRVSADYVLLRLVEIDQMDVLDILDDDGGLKPISQWPKIWRTTLSGLDINRIRMAGKNEEDDIESTLQKIKWPDKVKNLELIGKHVDVMAFKERIEVSGTVTIADRMAKARRRVKEQSEEK